VGSRWLADGGDVHSTGADVPFYKAGPFWVDAYFIERLASAHNRILLVVGGLGPSGAGGLRPIPYPRVVELLREGAAAAESLLAEIKNRLTSGRKELALAPLYNPGAFMGRRSDALSDSAALSLALRLYRAVLSSLPEEPEALGWARLELKGGEVYLSGSRSPQYTYLYRTDRGFREALDALLRPGNAGGPIDV
jgi:hypothetical protein